MSNYFISRAGADSEWGLWMAEIVKELGHEYTLQDHHFPVGSNFIHEISAAIARSNHAIAFYSAAYAASQYCMAEFDAALNRDIQGRDRYLLIVRLDDTAIPPLAAQHVFLPLRERSPQARRQLIARLKGELPSYKDETHRTFISKLPAVDTHLFGREKELARLDAAWSDPEANIISVVAGGGTGKTALVDHWFRRHVNESTIFGWSFYSQGSTLDRQTSSEPFFNEAASFFGIKIDHGLSVFARAEALARRLRDERVLLILDGLEPLQATDGTLRDNAMKALLSELRARNKGLAVCSSRLPLDVPTDGHHSIAIDLDNLDSVAGAQYLAHLGVEGPQPELEAASQDFGNHALALTLLGPYLVDYLDRDVRRRADIPALPVDPESKAGAHARRMMDRYGRVFEGKPERAVLSALGYFDRPAEPDALKLVLPRMADIDYRRALNRLKQARLILSSDPSAEVDCHPLIREHFAAEATAAGHAKLYEHYCEKAPHRPDTEVEMIPLFHAVFHGCRAGKQQQTLDQVYFDRLLRGNEFYLTRKLGAFATRLSLLACFFHTAWSEPHPSLSPRWPC